MLQTSLRKEGSSMSDDLRKVQLRAVQYFFVDGTFEFGFGLLCLILAAFFFLENRIHGWLLALTKRI